MKPPEKQNAKKANVENRALNKSEAALQNKLPVAANSFDEKVKKIFFISLVVMQAVLWFSGYDVGYHMDEMDMNNYCKNNYQFYFSGGKDTSYRSSGVAGVASVRGVRQDTLLRYYGCAFEYLPVGFNEITGLDKGKNEFNSRHIFNQLFAVLCILFAGLSAYKIAGWRAAVFTEWLLFLTPTFFGHALFNTKDIPFSTGFAASVYFIILFLEGLPKPSWKATLGLMLSLAFTMGIRIGGLILVLYCFLFIGFYLLIKQVSKEDLLRNAKGISLKLAVAVFGALTVVVLSWPFLLGNPLKNIPATLNVVSKFPANVPLPFDGNFISSLTIPWYYLPKFMLLTIPVFIIVSFFIALVLISRSIDINRRIAFIVLFACVFPVVYAVVKHMALYSAWRHFLFVYPGIVIISGVGLNEMMKRVRKPVFQTVFVVLCLAAMCNPIVWSISNHPYEYTYFNEMEGGYKNAVNNYETDYWEITVKTAIDWLFKNEPILASTDTVPIISNVSLFTNYYIGRNYPEARVKIIDGGFKSRSFTGWKYAIFNTIFLPQNVIDADFPPNGTIHTIDIDNLPATAVIRDTERLDAWGIYDLLHFEYSKADSFFNAYMARGDRNNMGMYGYMGIAKAMTGQYREAYGYGKKGADFDNSNFASFFAVGLAGILSNHYKEGYPFILQAYAYTLYGQPNVLGSNQHEFVVTLLNNIDPALLRKVEEDVKNAKQ